MAREEVPREDLIRDGVAFVDRVELVGTGTPIFIGFRKDGSVSFYFGEEPVYQFNPSAQMRRAHHDGMIKAEAGKLVRLRKKRQHGEVQLIRNEFDESSQRGFLSQARNRLADLQRLVNEGALSMSRQVSTDGNDVLPRVMAWLDAMPEELEAAPRL